MLREEIRLNISENYSYGKKITILERYLHEKSRFKQKN